MKIDSLLDEIRKQDLVLPEFQREYVWSRDQAKQLLASLLKGYPVGALLIWRTDQSELVNTATPVGTGERSFGAQALGSWADS